MQEHSGGSFRKGIRPVQPVIISENRLMKCYPNPASDLINIPYYFKEDQGSIEIHDLLGKLVRMEKVNKGYNLLQLNVSGLTKWYVYCVDERSKWTNSIN